MTHLIAGYGEVGQGMGEVISRSGQSFIIYDPQKGFNTSSDQKVHVDAIHICFPYSYDFIRQVGIVRELFLTNLVIIHSTIQVGTTRVFGGRKGIAYSFVRGRHPNLGTEMTKHMKHIGAVHPDDAIAAFNVLTDLGFMCQIQSSPEAVELGKLWDTTYYGICIAATKMAKEIADTYDVPWRDMAQMNESYNATAEAKFIRPQLEPIDGPIGGHCVIPNTKLLAENLEVTYPLLEGVLYYSGD